MPSEIDLQTRFEAEDLYVYQRLNYQQVAERLGVSQSTVERWGRDGDWRGLRTQVIESRRTLRTQLQDLRDALLKQATESRDPQKAFAALRVVEAERKQIAAENKTAGPEAIDAPRVFMGNLEFIANFLKENDPQGLKILAQNFDAMIEKFKESNARTA